MAVILQGVGARLKKGQAVSAQAKTYAAMAGPSMLKAWQLANDAALDAKL